MSTMCSWEISFARKHIKVYDLHRPGLCAQGGWCAINAENVTFRRIGGKKEEPLAKLIFSYVNLNTGPTATQRIHSKCTKHDTIFLSSVK